MKVCTNLNHDRTMCREQEPLLHLYFFTELCPFEILVWKSCPLYNLNTWNFVQIWTIIRRCAENKNRNPTYIFIRPFEKRSYYVIPLGVRPSVRPSVCKLYCFRVTPPTVYVRLSWNLVYSKAMRWFNAYYLEVMVQRFLAKLQPFN